VYDSYKCQVTVSKVQRHSIPPRWTGVHEGSNTVRRQCGSLDIELSTIH